MLTLCVFSQSSSHLVVAMQSNLLHGLRWRLVDGSSNPNCSLAACPDVIHPAMVVDMGTDLWFLLLSSEVAVCVSNEVVLWGLLAISHLVIGRTLRAE